MVILLVLRNRQTKWGFERGVEENLAYGKKFVFERQILGIKAW